MRAISLAVVLIIAGWVAGCGESDKAGGSGGPVSLTLAADEPADRPATAEMNEFAKLASELSDGSVRIKVKPRANGPQDVDDWDQRIVRKVVAGEFDMGMIPSRAWDTEGVTSLRALQAPFLVTSDTLLARVVTSDIADDLLSGLGAKGLVGLGLLPDQLRHPFAFGQPLLTPRDYEGGAIRSPRSEDTYALLRAFGALPDDMAGTLEKRIKDGTVRGAEGSYVNWTAVEPTTATGNVTYFARVNTLVINKDAWKRLSDEQRSALREAARRTTDWARGNISSDVTAAKRYCAAGGTVVLADRAHLDALAAAARPVYARLEQDATTKALIARIRTLKRQVRTAGDGGVKPCSSGSGGSGTEQANRTAGPIPDGVYRNVSELDDLRAAGISDDQGYGGVHTVTLEDGKLKDEIKGDVPSEPCYGTYTSTRSTVEVTFLPPHCSGGFTAKWRLDGDSLTLTDIQDPDPDSPTPVVFGSNPFKKIG